MFTSVPFLNETFAKYELFNSPKRNMQGLIEEIQSFQVSRILNIAQSGIGAETKLMKRFHLFYLESKLVEYSLVEKAFNQPFLKQLCPIQPAVNEPLPANGRPFFCFNIFSSLFTFIQGSTFHCTIYIHLIRQRDG